MFQKIRRPEGQLETKLAEAELRRKELQEEKVKQVMDHTGLERHGRMRSASAYRYQNFILYFNFLNKLTNLHSEGIGQKKFLQLKIIFSKKKLL